MSVELARLAWRCAALRRAQILAGWVGDGKPVTAKGVLRPADARAAAQAAGITVPAHLRSAADIPALHHPWLVAQATGMLTLDAARAAASKVDSGGSLATWLAGLDGVLRAESSDQPRRHGAAVLCRVLLGLLDAEAPPVRGRLPHAAFQILSQEMDLAEAGAAFRAFGHAEEPVDAAVAVLVAFGAVDGHARVTPLGRWAYQQLQARVPRPVTPELPAAELLARLCGLPDDQVWQQARGWWARRSGSEAAEELLGAAAGASPLQRTLAVELVAEFGRGAPSVWQRALSVPNLAAHARWMLADDDPMEALADADRWWLVTEYALVTLAKHDIEDAYHYLQEHGGVETLDRSGHPEAGSLRQALDACSAAGGGRPRIYQVKIELRRVRPATWRRVLVPSGASLGALHQVIQALYGWGESHLHAFTTAEGARYSDPFSGLEDCGDEDDARLSKILPRPGAAMSYVYDFGDWWEHQITLEKVLDPDPALAYPTCLAGRGDAPVEDWTPDDLTESIPFDRDDINRRLAQSPHQRWSAERAAAARRPAR